MGGGGKVGGGEQGRGGAKGHAAASWAYLWRLLVRRSCRASRASMGLPTSSSSVESRGRGGVSRLDRRMGNRSFFTCGEEKAAWHGTQDSETCNCVTARSAPKHGPSCCSSQSRAHQGKERGGGENKSGFICVAQKLVTASLCEALLNTDQVVAHQRQRRR